MNFTGYPFTYHQISLFTCNAWPRCHGLFGQNRLHRRSPTAVRHRCAQRCDNENEHSAATAKTSTTLWQWKQAQSCDSSGSDSAEVTMCTLVWQRWQLTVLWQRCQFPLLSPWCPHRCHSNMNIAVTALTVDTAVTLVRTVMLQRCHCHRCCTVVSLHRWHTNVAAIAVTVLSRPLLS